MIEIDYDKLKASVRSGTLRVELEEELTRGFRKMLDRGERIPPASYLATKIAEIVNQGAEEEMESELAFDVYQEVASACENARELVLGDQPKPN
ncbi:MAG: hypothetical protein R3338_09050 [Thermoanaerobaculia bacterium]|nr:hypothetical protein [Thermoanaerobaculia bacterium]